MPAAVQQRTLVTRERLLDAGRKIVSEVGYEALRVEEVVAHAGVAKGTFFAHFSDKDGIMDLLIGEQLDTLLDEIEAGETLATIDALVDALRPSIQFLTAERYVFDVFARLSGALAVDNIGRIASTFVRQHELLAIKLDPHAFRGDIDIDLVVEGIQAFYMNALALSFCAIDHGPTLDDRLHLTFSAWMSR